MIEIEQESEAFVLLKRWINDPTTYKISLAVREDTKQVAIKVNERMWTLPLDAQAEGGPNDPVRPGNTRSLLSWDNGKGIQEVVQ